MGILFLGAHIIAKKDKDPSALFMDDNIRHFGCVCVCVFVYKYLPGVEQGAINLSKLKTCPSCCL